MRLRYVKITLCGLIVAGMNGAAMGALLWPLNAGTLYEYTRTDNTGQQWSTTFEITTPVTHGTTEYFKTVRTNYNNDGAVSRGDLRSTENVVYEYNWNGQDDIVFQEASMGTSWTINCTDGEYNWEVYEIVNIGPVTVPYGTFAESYTFRGYECVDLNNLGLGQSPSWYGTIVPGVGYVKEVDYWNDAPPTIQELVTITPEPGTLALLVLGGMIIIRRRGR
jgi:hypothetical protein